MGEHRHDRFDGNLMLFQATAPPPSVLPELWRPCVSSTMWPMVLTGHSITWFLPQATATIGSGLVAGLHRSTLNAVSNARRPHPNDQSL